MYCPFKMASPGYSKQCDTSMCAWWYEGDCSIKLIAWEMKQLSEILRNKRSV